MTLIQLVEERFEFGVNDETYLGCSIIVRDVKTVAEARKLAKGFASLVAGPIFDLNLGQKPKRKKRRVRNKR